MPRMTSAPRAHGWSRISHGGAHAALALIGVLSTACARGSEVRLAHEGEPVTVRRAALYPETLEYDARANTFLAGSLREGAIYEVDATGDVKLRVDDPRLCSVLGIAVDAERGMLWAVNSDLGASLKPSAEGPKNLAAVGVYDLQTGKPIRYVDLAPLAAGPHLVNGIALDRDGSAYITDSFSPSIYKVDREGRASLFLRSEQFAGDGINLNGVVVHPDGYLLVVKKSDGSLFRVPLSAPERFTRVNVAQRFVGGDGLVLASARSLVLIANQTPSVATNAAFSLTSDDGWTSAEVRATRALGDVYPTTAVLRDGTLYVLHSKLNELIQSAPEQKAKLRMQATVQPIGKAAR